jgi:hypothetical protein
VFISRIRRPKSTIFLEETGFFGGTQKKCRRFSQKRRTFSKKRWTFSKKRWTFSEKRRSFLFDSLEKDEERREKRQNKKELPHHRVGKFQAENRRLRAEYYNQ